jgi:hypothetical protein
LVGCSRTFEGQVAQPNPLAQPGHAERASVPIVIVTGDKDLPKVPVSDDSGGAVWGDFKPYPLRNIAQFMVVSRDRLRFHVHLEHKWEEYADPTNWRATLIVDRDPTDKQHQRYQPENVEKNANGHVSKMWDYEQRSFLTDPIYGDIVYVNNDGHRRRQKLYSWTIYQGDGDFVFYARDLFTPDVQRVRLILSRRTTAFQFTWKLGPDKEAGGEVHTARAP